MEAANIRQKLHHYVDSGDEKLLNPNFAIEQFMPVCLNFGK